MNVQSLAAVLLVIALVPAVVAAQEPEKRPQPVPAGNGSPRQPSEERTRPLATSNVQIEIVVTDSVGSGAPQKKTVSMIVADGYMGRIRSTREGGEPAMLNVDATPNLQSNDRIRLQLLLVYLPPREGQATRYAAINEMVTILLQPGKPTMVSQAADPAADRKVTVEVTATILK
ncbi:MAG TPA: hypothetical protein VMO26_13105 [Vicinamibacterales bacterium]|nr:hypothetical protein [Vicinamibacterales bacterium]